MNVRIAMETLKRELIRDEDYAYGWFCNLKMSYVDAGVSQEKARDSALSFMHRAFGVNYFKHPKFK